MKKNILQALLVSGLLVSAGNVDAMKRKLNEEEQQEKQNKDKKKKKTLYSPDYVLDQMKYRNREKIIEIWQSEPEIINWALNSGELKDIDKAFVQDLLKNLEEEARDVVMEETVDENSTVIDIDDLENLDNQENPVNNDSLVSLVKLPEELIREITKFVNSSDFQSWILTNEKIYNTIFTVDTNGNPAPIMMPKFVNLKRSVLANNVYFIEYFLSCVQSCLQSYVRIYNTIFKVDTNGKPAPIVIPTVLANHIYSMECFLKENASTIKLLQCLEWAAQNTSEKALQTLLGNSHVSSITEKRSKLYDRTISQIFTEAAKNTNEKIIQALLNKTNLISIYSSREMDVLDRHRMFYNGLTNPNELVIKTLLGILENKFFESNFYSNLPQGEQKDLSELARFTLLAISTNENLIKDFLSKEQIKNFLKIAIPDAKDALEAAQKNPNDLNLLTLRNELFKSSQELDTLLQSAVEHSNEKIVKMILDNKSATEYVFELLDTDWLDTFKHVKNYRIVLMLLDNDDFLSWLDAYGARYIIMDHLLKNNKIDIKKLLINKNFVEKILLDETDENFIDLVVEKGLLTKYALSIRMPKRKK